MGEVRQLGIHELLVEQRAVDGCWVRVGESPAELEAATWTTEQHRVYAGMPAPVYANEKRLSEVKDQLAALRRGAEQLRAQAVREPRSLGTEPAVDAAGEPEGREGKGGSTPGGRPNGEEVGPRTPTQESLW